MGVADPSTIPAVACKGRCRIRFGSRGRSMRRTTSRGSRHSANGARRAVRSVSRGRAGRSKRAPKPHLTQRQAREITGVLLILIALLGLLALASNAGSILIGIRDWLVATFDRAWFVPVGAALALGAYLLWPKAHRPRPVDIVSGAVAVIALVGIFGLTGHGGSAGEGIDRAVIQVLGLSLIHISEPTRLGMISYAVFCLKK